MKQLKRYSITLAIGLVIAFAVLLIKDFFSQTEAATIFAILCDAFCISGVLVTGAGLLIFSSNEGTFDILVYGVKSFWGFFKKDKTKKHDTFYDYRASRAEHKMAFGYIVLCGLILLAISGIMLALNMHYR